MKLFNIFKGKETVNDNCLRNAHDEHDNQIIENAIWENIVKQINENKQRGNHFCYISSLTWNYIPKHLIQRLLDENYDIKYNIYKNDCTVFIKVLWNQKTNGTVFFEKLDNNMNHNMHKTGIDEMYENIENAISSYRKGL